MAIISRDNEIDRIKLALGRGNNVVLKGSFGSGKTSILMTVARETKSMLPVYPYSEIRDQGRVYLENIYRDKNEPDILLLDEASALMNGDYTGLFDWIVEKGLRVVVSSPLGLKDFQRDEHTLSFFATGFIEIALKNGDLREGSESLNPMFLR